MVSVKLTPQQRRELIAEAQCSVNTLKRWLDKRPMKPTVKDRIDAAWSRLRTRQEKKGAT